MLDKLPVISILPCHTKGYFLEIVPYASSGKYWQKYSENVKYVILFYADEIVGFEESIVNEIL